MLAAFAPTEAHAFLFGSKKKADPNLLKASGAVGSVDLRKSLVTVVPKSGAGLVFMVDKNTEISKQGKKISLMDLSWGNPVQVDYVIQKSQYRARFIYVDGKPAEKPKPAFDTPKRRR
jgi:hypothetical protein